MSNPEMLYQCPKCRLSKAPLKDWSTHPRQGYGYCRICGSVIERVEAEQPPKTMQETLKDLRKAGGDAWDDVADPEELLGRKEEACEQCKTLVAELERLRQSLTEQHNVVIAAGHEHARLRERVAELEGRPKQATGINCYPEPITNDNWECLCGTVNESGIHATCRKCGANR
jgi:uncharacterized Zn finger protein (UPF0148 family)